MRLRDQFSIALRSCGGPDPAILTIDRRFEAYCGRTAFGQLLDEVVTSFSHLRDAPRRRSSEVNGRTRE